MTTTKRLEHILPGIIALFFSLSTFAQTNSSIKGTLNDNSNKPIDRGTISLLHSVDSVLVKVATTDTKGAFEFVNIKNGTYLLKVSTVGFQNWISKPVTVNGKDIIVDPISLEPASKGLSEVVVTAKKPFIEQKIDKMVVNVEASPTNAGATAMEVLEKSPGIIINSDGTISLKGKAGVNVMIDG
ncbi:MAG: TonB-dependent receptor, partial [Bacteroidetes bacterium]